MVYQIPSSAVKLANVFRQLEAIKESLDIEGYSISQTTLDDVRTNKTVPYTFIYTPLFCCFRCLYTLLTNNVISQVLLGHSRTSL